MPKSTDRTTKNAQYFVFEGRQKDLYCPYKALMGTLEQNSSGSSNQFGKGWTA